MCSANRPDRQQFTFLTTVPQCLSLPPIKGGGSTIFSPQPLAQNVSASMLIRASPCHRCLRSHPVLWADFAFNATDNGYLSATGQEHPLPPALRVRSTAIPRPVPTIIARPFEYVGFVRSTDPMIDPQLMHATQTFPAKNQVAIHHHQSFASSACHGVPPLGIASNA